MSGYSHNEEPHLLGQSHSIEKKSKVSAKTVAVPFLCACNIYCRDKNILSQTQRDKIVLFPPGTRFLSPGQEWWIMNWVKQNEWMSMWDHSAAAATSAGDNEDNEDNAKSHQRKQGQAPMGEGNNNPMTAWHWQHSSYSMSKKGWWIQMQSSDNALIGL
jgi:hypothetical protein